MPSTPRTYAHAHALATILYILYFHAQPHSERGILRFEAGSLRRHERAWGGSTPTFK
eukprot:COSAG05_NODE_33_length_28089_cov_31.909289_9_plen_57_part_00